MNHNVLAALVQADIPVNLSSSPGAGKTAYTSALAKAIGFESNFHAVILSQADPTDIGGWPRDNGEYIVRKPLDWLHRLHQAPGMLFLDEITLAPRACLAGALQLINERQAGGTLLHPDSRIITACNPEEFTGVTMLPQLANRLAHVDFDEIVSVSKWAQGMMSGFPELQITRLPEAWTALIPKHRAIVASYAVKMGSEAFRKPKDEADWGKAWPSRRTLTLAATASAACESIGEEDSSAVASLIGHAATLAYLGWREEQDLGDPEEALDNPTKYPLPKEDDRLYILLSSIAAVAISKKNVKPWNAAWVILERACKQGQTDVAVTAARTIAEATPWPAGAVTPKSILAFTPILKASLGVA
jgi:hypothetical protein